MAKKKNTNKKNVDYRNSNIISVHIYDGVNLFAKNDDFKDVITAQLSAERIIKSQKSIDPNSTAYACVWAGKKLVKYID